MGKVINSTFVSLDGVINHMERWHFDYIDEETDRITLEQLQACTSMLMGRKTYEVYASVWPERDGQYPDEINRKRKHVVSSTLEWAGWANTTVLRGDLVTEVAELKQQPGDILMHGFGPVAHTLMANGQLDELHLWVHPQFAGLGGPDDTLLRPGPNTKLELTRAHRLGSGVVLLSYQVG